jgi:hypothetical protein
LSEDPLRITSRHNATPDELTGLGSAQRAISGEDLHVRRNMSTLFLGFSSVVLGLFLLIILFLGAKDALPSGLSSLVDCVGLIGLVALVVLTIR